MDWGQKAKARNDPGLCEWRELRGFNAQLSEALVEAYGRGLQVSSGPAVRI